MSRRGSMLRPHGALERIWEVVRGLNRSSSRGRRGSSRRTRRGRARRRRSTTSPTGCGSSPSRWPRTCPRPRNGSSRRSGFPRDSTGTASHTEERRHSDGITPAAAAVPADRRAARRSVTDSHAHLDACDGPDARRRTRAGGRASTASSRSAPASSRAGPRWRSPTRTKASSPRSASIRTAPPSADADAVDELRPCSTTRRRLAVGETGLDDFHHYATLEQQRGSSWRSSSSPRAREARRRP